MDEFFELQERLERQAVARKKRPNKYAVVVAAQRAVATGLNVLFPTVPLPPSAYHRRDISEIVFRPATSRLTSDPFPPELQPRGAELSGTNMRVLLPGELPERSEPPLPLLLPPTPLPTKSIHTHGLRGKRYLEGRNYA